MTPEEIVVLARYVRALCPQQKFDEYTPDAWHDVLGEYRLDEARAAAARVAKGQPFVSPSEIIDAIKRQREDTARDFQGPGLAAAIPDADPDDVTAYLAAIRQQRYRAASGLELTPRPMAELLAGVGREVPAEDEKPRGPVGVPCPHCEAKPLRACSTPNGRRMAIFHPGRIDNARRIAAGQAPVDAEAEQLERERRIAASRAALAAEQPAEQNPDASRSAS